MTVAVKELVTEQYLPIELLQSVALDRPLHRFTLEEYHWLIEHSFFQPEDRVELSEGFLVEMRPRHPLHAETVSIQAFPDCQIALNEVLPRGS